MWDPDTKRNVGIFSALDGPHAQDAVLHSIFAGILSTPLRNLDEQQHTELIYTLFRLFVDEWRPARTFFYLVTGQLLQRDTVETVVTDFLYKTGEALALNARTINGDCDRKCSLLNGLWFDADRYYDEEEDDESESSESSSESGSESDDFSPTVEGEPEDIDQNINQSNDINRSNDRCPVTTTMPEPGEKKRKNRRKSPQPEQAN